MSRPARWESLVAGRTTSRAGSSVGREVRTKRSPEKQRGVLNMCGIIGYIGSKPVVPVLLDGLRRMEYRGYDSAGVALVSPEGIALRRSAGELGNLALATRRGTVAG